MDDALFNRFEFNIDIDELTNEHPKFDAHINCNIILKDHQLTLLKRCIDYENEELHLKDFPLVSHNGTKYANSRFKTRMGILGDRVGSGKSYVILALIKSNNIMNADNTIIKSYGLNNVVYYIPDSKRAISTNILLIPHNLCSQWEKYIKQFNPEMKYKIVNRQKVIDLMHETTFNIEDYELIVVTSTFYNKVAKYISDKDVKVQRMIVDEVDNLNTPGCINIDSCFTWFITASYGNLLYPRGYSKYEPTMQRHIYCATGLRNSGYIKNIFMDLYMNMSKDFMKILIIKNSEAYVQSSICLPDIFKFIIKCKTPNTIRLLSGIVDKHVIEYLNANDVNGALQYINPNNKGTEDNIITLLIEKFNKQLINITLNINMVNQMMYENENDRVAEIERNTSKKREIENKINALTERVKNNNVCAICIDDIEDNRTITKCCQNAFCFKCINTWLIHKAVCPLCKVKLTMNDYLVIKKDYQSENIVVEEPEIDETKVNPEFDKYKNLEIILNEKVKRKILIFSAYDSSFTEVKPILEKLKIKFEYLKGSGYQINSMINKYNSGDIDILLVNMRHYGCGLNIEKTTDIIMFHRFDNQAEQQLIGRAQRMGRTEPLNVHYLLYENEIR